MLFVISEMVFVTTIFGMARRHYDENYQPMNKVKYHIYGARRAVLLLSHAVRAAVRVRRTLGPAPQGSI